ncbi:MAG: YbdD/YjiX family protein [Nitrosomonas sp.]|nr:YbdD/YjiX family protein [Nitrosomonas sp.]MBP7112099.1 YbdD/YjiX family protein [Nitrosomonas sp.]
MIHKISQTLRQFSQSMRLMVGMPEYSTYVEHMKTAHPDQSMMSYEEFFRERQEARYGSKGRLNRCC